MFLVAANTRQALVGQKEWITTGSSGIQVQFLFSADWDGLAKFAVFRNAEIEESVIPIALPASGLTELPAENCAAEYVDEKVYVGVYGTDGLGHIIIPTIWVSLGVLKEGAAYEGMDPPQPTQDMWAQILAIAQNAGAENAAAAEQSAEEAEASKEAIQDMNVQAETLPDESPLTVTKEVDPETGAVTLIFGLTRGPKGTKGDDGYSPTITITPIQGGHRFTVTDKDHPTGQSFDVMNGAPGAPGSPGQDGYSPAITITTITGGHRFTVTDEDHPTGQSFDVMDGTKGDAGYSPAVTITTITGGHRVTITDEDHPTGQSFDVLDGASDAGQVTFDPTQTYQSGTVGKELSDQSNAISQNEESIENINKTIGGNVLETIGSVPGYINAAGNISPAGAETKEITYNQIAVNENDKIKLSVKIGGNPWFAIGYYGSDMNYIKRDAWVSYDTFDGTYYEKTVLITVPENVYAIRVSMRTYDNYDAELVFDGNMQSAINTLRDDVDTLDENVSGITGDAQNSAKALQTLNLFNRSSYTVGNINSDGTTTIVNYNKTGTTDFIPVEAGEYYTLQEWATPLGDSNPYKLGYTVLFFDSNKSPIASSYKQTLAPSVLDTYFAMTLVAPSSAKYVRISVRYLDTQETRLMINKGTLAMAYLKSSDDMDADRQSVLNSLSSVAHGLTSPLLRPAYPRVMMHRGFSSQAPENTIPAFVLAGQGGAWGIETDVYETIDGYFVLSHDNDVSRMTDGTGNITEMTYAQTQECTIDAGSNVDQYPNLKMPVLSDYLKICRKYGCVAAIEIKTITNYDKLVKVIKDYGMEGSVVILTNYSVDKLRTIRSLIQCPLCFVCTGQSHINTLLTVAQNNVDIWASVYSLYITQENIDACHELSMPFVGWTYTTQSGCESAVNMGMDIITAENFAKYIPQ